MFVGAPQCFGYRPSNILNYIATTFASLSTTFIYYICIFNLVQVQLIKYHVDLAIGTMQMEMRIYIFISIYESTSTRAAGDRVFRCTYHKRTCLDVWSAYAAIMRRLSTKCFTKLQRGLRILAYVRSRRLEPNVRHKSDLEARARRQNGVDATTSTRSMSSRHVAASRSRANLTFHSTTPPNPSVGVQPPPRAQCSAEVTRGGARAASNTAWKRPQVHAR